MTDSDLLVEQVDGRRGIARFVDVAWRVQAGRGTPWVPPLRVMVKDVLDVRKNPFYREADLALFVAMRDGDPVGRIAAIENRWHNEHHGDRVGFFGFFECLDDREAATALLRAAEGWLAARGLDRARGPMSPSMNHECGLLVGGFEHHPTMMTPWNPPYYAELLEAAGYGGVQDLVAFDIPGRKRLAVPERVGQLAERARRKTGVTFRTIDTAILEREARGVLDLYIDAWSNNWGFVPPSWDEFWHTARDLKSVLAKDFSFVAEVDGEMVGFMFIAWDLNEVLRSIPSGRLWPWNVVKLLLGLRKVRRGRVILLGLKHAYRHRGLFPLFVYEASRRGLELGVDGEAAWILDDNAAMAGPLAAMGLSAYKRWRIYERAIGASGGGPSS